MTASANPGSTFISRMLYPEIVNLLMIPVSLNFLTGLTVVSDIPICLAISTNGVRVFSKDVSWLEQYLLLKRRYSNCLLQRAFPFFLRIEDDKNGRRPKAM